MSPTQTFPPNSFAQAQTCNQGNDFDIFYYIITGSQVEQAVTDLLKKWLRVYLIEVTLQLGRPRDSTPIPRSYITVNEFERYDEDQMPTIMVMSTGTADQPTADGEGFYYAYFNIGISGIVSARDRACTNDIGKIYAAAIRALILQKPDLEGFANDAVWLGETYDDIASGDEDRNLSACLVSFNIAVANVVNRLGGPRTYPYEPPDPDTQPGSQWPEFQTVDVEVIKEDIID
jgi:hypothetical protein